MHAVTTLSLADWVFMFFVIVTLGCLMTRRDALLPSAIGLLVVGTILKGSLIGGLMVAFNAIMASTTDLLNIIILIALIVMMTKTMEDMGCDRLMVVPIRRFLGNAYISYWVLGIAMLVLSWFIWPTPAAPLLGALAVPLAIKSGLPPMVAAMALSIFGKGVGLSSDFIIQGSPTVTAKITNIPVDEIMAASVPIWAAVSIVAVTVSFILTLGMIRASKRRVDGMKQSAISMEVISIGETAATVTVSADSVCRVMAWVIPIAFIADIYFMLTQKIKGGGATALIGGTALMLTMINAVLHYKDGAFAKTMGHAREGWMFAVKVFGPVVMIAGFFWLGGDSIKQILGDNNAQGLMFNWGYYISSHVPVNKFMVALMVTIAGVLGAFDGSGYAAIPLGASIGMALGKPIGANTAILASQAQMAAVWTGATLVPWGFLAVTAAITAVDPKDLARRNVLPTLLGLAAGVIVTTLLE